MSVNMTTESPNVTTTSGPPSMMNMTTTSVPSTMNMTTSPWDPLNPPSNKCNYYIKNETVVVFDLGNQYGGIPQNLLLNLIGWAILMILFAILRRSAGNYGRLALAGRSQTDNVRKDDDESRWTQVFFAPDENLIADEEIDNRERFPSHEEEILNEPDSLASVDYSEVDSGICSWIISIFTLSDEKYLRKCGNDAVQYLRFQRYLIAFVSIITAVCIGIILPINFQGEIQGTDMDFGHTTISNLRGSDEKLWVHVVIVILFFPLGIFIMRKFSVDLKIAEQEDECLASRTLMVVGIPDNYCTKDLLIRHFHEAYPEIEVDDVQVAYDVSKLSALDERRELARKARIYCENYAGKHGGGQQMRPFACGIICKCCGQTVNALTFYKREEEELKKKVEEEKTKIKTKSIGIAFITFNTLADAKKVSKDHKGRLKCFSNPPSSSLSKLLEPHTWSVRSAPPPEDIYWQNLNETHRLFFIKALMINLLLFLVFFFFSSPTYIISQFEAVLNFKNMTHSEKLNDFIPTLMLWTLTAVLPILVAYSDWIMGHWRRSVENLWIMRKVFFYLLFMVLILPSIGLTSLRAVFELFIKSTSSPDTRYNTWSCIFLPDNGAFFVNYVITSGLVGIALEFMRFSELLLYAVRMMLARSVAETPSVRKAGHYEFMFGYNYGWMLLIFALTAAYAVVCPLITPFGLFYMVMKHGVDRYNLYFAYKRSKINKNIHATAVNCVTISLLIQQLILLFFNIVRSQDTSTKILSPRAIFSLTMLIIFTILFLAQIFFQAFKGISPLQYVQMANTPSSGSSSQNETSDEEQSTRSQRRKRKTNKQFVPEVLRKDLLSNQNGDITGLTTFHTNENENQILTQPTTTTAYGATSDLH